MRCCARDASRYHTDCTRQTCAQEPYKKNTAPGKHDLDCADRINQEIDSAPRDLARAIWIYVTCPKRESL